MPALTASSLPPLHARPLRDLTLRPRDHPRGAPHLSAASGLVCAHGRAYVIADDEHHLAVFGDLRSPGTLHRIRAGDLPDKTKARKRRKPDLETLLWLPAFGEAGTLVALGSGSRENRCTGVAIPLDRRGQPLAQVQAFDLAPLYGPLLQQLGGLNIEGAMAIGDSVVLLNRGGRDGLANAAVRFPLATMPALMRRSRDIDARCAIQRFDLGHLDGVALGFTDGAARPDGSWLFSAAAERSDDSVADGPCAGSVVGEVSARGELVTMRCLDSRHKVEGIAVQPDGPAICLVTDADDPQQCARLLRAAWPDARG
ncbi:MAG TPA: hypothetical protein VLJ62_28680 [Burkholderiaceae bacterium]|nr:hypothetical protein [Burkholderiaceae bacterium]